jgi:hypothetical protein
VSEAVSLEGIPVKYLDTAGIWDQPGSIEALGIERSLRAMADADLTLVVFDLSVPYDPELAEKARQQGMDVKGPFPADTIFVRARKGEFAGVVTMYHDQGLAPLKMVCFEHGVNWTLGLPFIRTSPDHGTAYDIAGQNQANPSSMLAALRLARQLLEPLIRPQFNAASTKGWQAVPRPL